MESHWRFLRINSGPPLRAPRFPASTPRALLVELHDHGPSRARRCRRSARLSQPLARAREPCCTRAEARAPLSLVHQPKSVRATRERVCCGNQGVSPSPMRDATPCSPCLAFCWDDTRMTCLCRRMTSTRWLSAPHPKATSPMQALEVMLTRPANPRGTASPRPRPSALSRSCLQLVFDFQASLCHSRPETRCFVFRDLPRLKMPEAGASRQYNST